MDLKRRSKPAANEQRAPAGARAPAMPKAPLIEIFHSVQGEGRFVGVPMTFVRVRLVRACLYCDTPNSYDARRSSRAHAVRETRETQPRRRRPRGGSSCASSSRERGRRQDEPREHSPRRALVVPRVRARVRAPRARAAWPATSRPRAIHPDALAACVDQVDHLSADYKLPETLGAPAQASLALALRRVVRAVAPPLLREGAETRRDRRL